jgi:mannose-6-phosphate isomerase-like protein (cupin superfamily)
MRHFDKDGQTVKGWFVGPWNSSIPIAVGYANAGVDEPHYHAQMFEVYLVAQGRSTALVDDERVMLEAGSVLIVEPGEVHTFVESTPDYYHFVVHAPVVKGDKHFPQ